MKCYMCAQSNVDNEAVAVCAECGMGLCMEHAHRYETSILPHGAQWVSRAPMHILCGECAEALHPSG